MLDVPKEQRIWLIVKTPSKQQSASAEQQQSGGVPQTPVILHNKITIINKQSPSPASAKKHQRALALATKLIKKKTALKKEQLLKQEKQEKQEDLKPLGRGRGRGRGRDSIVTMAPPSPVKNSLHEDRQAKML